MKQLDDLLRMTTEMVETLNKLEREELERTEVIEAITELIEQREKILQQIKPPYTDEELKLGKKVVQMNEEITSKMENLYTLVKEDMSQVKQQKALNRSYINPYGSLKTTDGMYVDSKK